MVAALRGHRVLVVVALALLVFATAFLIDTATEVGAQEESLTFETGFWCFAAGEKRMAYGIGGPAGYDIGEYDIVVGSLMGNPGPGVVLRNVKLNVERDLIIWVLNKPATRPVCASFLVTQANNLG